MSATTFEFVETFLRGAQKRESERAYASAVTWYESAILELATIAVRDYREPSNGIGFLVERGTRAHLERCAAVMRQIPGSDELGIFNTIAVAHAASLLSHHELAEYMVSRVQHPGKHFWNEFARAMNCLLLKHPYEFKLGPLQGMDS